MSHFSSEFRTSFLKSIIDTLYTADIKLIKVRKKDLLTEAIKTAGYAKGYFSIYYSGRYFEIGLDSDYDDVIRMDLQQEFHLAMDKYLEDKYDLKSEIHNVEGLLRSVLNASETYKDISALMPKHVKHKVPSAFSWNMGALKLSDAEIAAFKVKHENMLEGLKQKVLRDLLLKQR